MPSPLSILVVEDDAQLRKSIGGALRQRGYHVTDTADGDDAMARIRSSVFDVVVSDVRLPRSDGFAILRQLREDSPDTEVVLMTAYGTIEDAVAAMRDRAFDYLTKPFDIQEFVLRIDSVAEKKRLREDLRKARAQLANMHAGPALIGRSPAIARLRSEVESVAMSDASVLIVGESGTGKELVARMVHERSERASKPFVAINCGAVPITLIEAELFGHERGAFTGAVKKRDGLFVTAHGGTVFLDEIGELPLEAQVKLLRVLQEGEITPVGSSAKVKVDVRLVSATNKDLREKITAGTFREDLYYRVKVFEFRVPPLRERPGDIPLLAEHFLRRFESPENERPALSPTALAALERHPFPGNVRELEHAILHGAVLARGGEIELEHLPPEIRGSTPSRPSISAMRTLSVAVADFEREYLKRVINLTSGRRAQAALALGISRKSLWQKLGKYGLADKEGPDPDDLVEDEAKESRS